MYPPFWGDKKIIGKKCYEMVQSKRGLLRVGPTGILKVKLHQFQVTSDSKVEYDRDQWLNLSITVIS